MSRNHSRNASAASSPSSPAPQPARNSPQPPVKERPLGKQVPCAFYNTPRGCYNGNKCRFLHGSVMSPKEENKICIFYARGFCMHGQSCWYKHQAPSEAGPLSTSTRQGSGSRPVVTREEEPDCGICFEKPTTFGLLSGCSHPFCLDCLRDWRASARKDSGLVESNIIKTCPLCRTESQFITPSSRFFSEGHPKKKEMMDSYRASMARLKCRYFESSPKNKRFCPYGSDCFYKHEDEDGKPYVFSSGADVNMPLFKDRQARATRARARERRYLASALGIDDLSNDHLGSFGSDRSSIRRAQEIAEALDELMEHQDPERGWSPALYEDSDDEYEAEHDIDGLMEEFLTFRLF